MTQFVNQVDFSQDNEDLFKQLSEAFGRYAAEAGVEVVPYRDSSLPLFRSLNELQQKSILDTLATRVRICERLKAEEKPLNSPPATIWGFLKESGLKPTSDLFGHIDEDSVVEVHSFEGIQLFCSFNFYRFCNYTLEELYSSPWDLLFERDEAPTFEMITFVKAVMSGEVRGVVNPSIQPHVVKELHSEKRVAVRLSMNLGGPLFEQKTGLPQATVMIERIDLMSRRPAVLNQPTPQLRLVSANL